MDTWQHKVTARVRAPKRLARSTSDVFEVTAGLLHLQGNARPYFSVTGWIGRPEDFCHTCGCLHSDILRTWPHLAPIVALHLSDDTGEPMHGLANGWYYLAGYYPNGADERDHIGNSPRQHWNADGTFDGYRLSTPEECLQVFADHVRIPFADALTLAKQWECADDWTASKRWFSVWYESQRPRFQSEADAAIALLDTLATKG